MTEATILKELESERAELDQLTARVVAEGLATLSARPRDTEAASDKILIVRGASNLLEDVEAQSDLQQVLNLLGVSNWLLGVDQPRTFLVQTMDRAELRPTGGFTGQYGELTINGGRIAPFALKDISLVEYVDSSKTLGQLAPAQYR